MRTIKFKAKRVDGKGWIFGNYMKYDSGVYIFPTKYSSRQSEDFKVDSSTVCQFTGLQDKNGKDIYEGDNYNTYEGVDYDCDTESYDSYIKHTHLIEYKEGVCSIGFSFVTHQTNIELTGNIHD